MDIGLVSCFIALLVLPTKPSPVSRRAVEVSNEGPAFCSISFSDLYERISFSHNLNVIGYDSKFEDFADRYMNADGNQYKEKSRDWWLLPEEEDVSNEARMRRRLDNNSDEFMLKPLCKSHPTYERRTDKIPFVRTTWTCEKNKFILNLEYECMPVFETRPILKNARGCSSFGSSGEEEWVHSTERVETGCEAVLKFKRSRGS